MNLIDQVARLKELEAKISQEGHGAPDPIWCEYSDDLRNAAPTVLEVLGGFRPGDADLLDRLPCFRADGDCDKCSPTMKAACGAVARMQAMATKMEEPDAR